MGVILAKLGVDKRILNQAEDKSPARSFAPSRPANPETNLAGERKRQTMNRLIQFKITPPLLITLALLCFGLLPRAQAAQIGASVSAAVSVENRVELDVSNDPQEVTHIVLDSGVWLISGQINFLSLSTPAGTMFTAGNISKDEPSFEPAATAAVQAEQVARLGNIIRNVALVPRTVEVEDGTSVFLVAGSFNPNPNVSAWGFITAVKIRNHAP
jgi:hypothetical protein